MVSLLPKFWSRRFALSRPGLALQAIVKARRRRRRHAGEARRNGYCPVCERDVSFMEGHGNHRESPVCMVCGSVPRQRALVALLPTLCELPGTQAALSDAVVHESSPSLATFRYFKRRAGSFLASYYFPGVARGRFVGQFQCIDLHDQPLPTAYFDLVVTHDVLEHVTDPIRALREIGRTLQPGGAHVFTVPRAAYAATRSRAVQRDGHLELLEPAEYHRDPVADTGALVVTDWGRDLEALLAAAGMACVAHECQDVRLGIPEVVEVFVARAEP